MISASGSQTASLTRKLLAVYIPLVSVSMLVIFAVIEIRSYHRKVDRLSQGVKQLTQLQRGAFTQAVWEIDDERLESLLRELQRTPGFSGAIVRDPSGQLLASVGELEGEPELTAEEALVYETEYAREQLGSLVVVFGRDGIHGDLGQRLRTDALILLLLTLSLVGITLLATRRLIVNPLDRLRERVLRIADGASEVSVAELRTGDEIGELAGAFATMQQKVSDREEALEVARESALHELMESAPDAMVVANTDGRICRVNSAAEVLFGYEAGALCGEPIESLLPERYRGGHGSHFSRYFQNPKARNMGTGLELFGCRKDGSEFPVEIGLSPFHDPDGTMAVAAIRDITARKQTEAELAAKEQRFRTLVANLPGTVYRCLHDDHWTMLFMSDDAETLTGYPAGDFIQNRVRTFDSVIHEGDREQVAAEIEAAVAKRDAWDIRYRIVRSDGQIRWIGERGRAILDQEEKTEYLDGVIVDITERERIEEELHTTNFLSDMALELTHCGYWHVDYSDPDYYYQSERAAEMLGEPIKPDGRYHLQDEWFARLVEANPETAESTTERYQGAIDGRYAHYESTYAYKRPIDGAVIWLHALGKVVRDENDRVEYMYGVYQDVTQRLANERALQEATHAAEAATSAKSEFLSHMSHELRTPLNGVLGYAQILQRDPDTTDGQKQSLGAIVNCGDHLLSLINDVLDLSKIEAGRIDVDKAPCDLHKLIQGVSDIVQQRATGKGLSFELEVSPEVPIGIITDAAKVRQMLVNLLGNAVKFTEEGGVALHLAESPKGMLRFDVIDTGVGMTDAELEDIFDPFKQVEAGKAAGGTGLGLAITKRLAEILGGDITVQSTTGEGSTFTVSIPLEEAGAEELSTLEADPALDQQDLVLAEGQELSVLVADDRVTNREILDQMLTHAGFRVVVADDGDTALQRVAEQRFDAVLMDVRMPRLNGIEAMKRIRADDSRRDLLVIAVTASVFPDFREKAIREGFDDFLAKPFRVEELMCILKKHLDVEWEEAGQRGQANDDGKSSDSADEDANPEPNLPEAAVEKLQGALKIKNISAIKKLAQELAADPETKATGDEMIRLVRTFDFNGLAALAERNG